MVVSNALAAVVVFVYLSWVVPVPSVPHPGRVTLFNLVVFAVYVAVSFPIVSAWSMRRVRPIRAWMLEGREPGLVRGDALAPGRVSGAAGPAKAYASRCCLRALPSLGEQVVMFAPYLAAPRPLPTVNPRSTGARRPRRFFPVP